MKNTETSVNAPGTEQNLRQRAVAFADQRKKGWVLNFMVNTISNFALGFASFYFRQQGLTFYKILLVWAIGPLASLPVVYFIKKWDTKKFLRLGVLSYIGAMLPLLFYSQYSYLIYGAFNGLMLGLFWVSFNTAYFNKSSKRQHAKDSSLYFISPAIAGIVMPPLGALVIDKFGYKILFFIAMLACLVPLIYIQGKYFNYKEQIPFKSASRDFSGIKLIVFLDSALHFFQWHYLTIYALLFLKTEYEFGSLLGYLALTSLFVSLALSYASDRYKKRVEILYPLLLGMAVLMVIMPSLHTLALLVPVIGLYAVLDNLSMPIRFAVHMDMGTRDTGFWRASEFYGNIGRSVIFAVSAICIYLDNYWLPFMLFALVAALLPFVIKYNLRKRQSILI